MTVYPACLVRCPAKVNLSLRVLGRREDGYHEIRTIFQSIDLEDELELYPADRLSLETGHRSLSTGEDNLVLKAARLLVEAAGPGRFGARMVLRKRIPLGGGLGGGSTDAAGALVGLCRLWSISPSAGELSEMAARLGADVPFFLFGGTAFGSGRGDRLSPLASLEKIPLVLGFPAFGIATHEVYRRYAEKHRTVRKGGIQEPLTPSGGSVTVPALFHKLVENKDFGLMHNDLEDVVLEGWPVLRGFRDALLDAGASGATISGSGSTVFGVFESSASALVAKGDLERRFRDWRVLDATTVPHGVRAEGSEGAEAARRSR
jgi:4-diphosphocytidyl-2-C-methyl-D-erythritol kinase